MIIGVYLREVKADDYTWIWECRNEEQARLNSLHTDVISIEEHTNWMEKSIRIPERKIMIGCDCENRIAVLRFDVDKNTATISINISSEYRGKGYSVLFLRYMENVIKEERNEVRILQATVKRNNIASIRAFTKANYSQVNSNVSFITFEKLI